MSVTVVVAVVVLVVIEENRQYYHLQLPPFFVDMYREDP